MKKFIIIFLIIILVLISIGIIYFSRNKKTYKIELPQIEHISNITIEQNGNNKLINEKQEIEKLLQVIETKTTNKQSIQDTPVNVENYIKIEFNSSENRKTIYIYKKNNTCYMEQPYNGIYEISIEEYNLIENL